MNRRMWLAVGVVVSSATFATGQTRSSVATTAPPSAGSASPSAAQNGAIYSMRTAGQPERRVQVVKSEQLPDGTFLTDVKDIESGRVFSIPNPAILAPTAQGFSTTPMTAPVVQRPQGEHLVPVPETTGVPMNRMAIAPTTGLVATKPAPTPSTPRPLFGSFSQLLPTAKQDHSANPLPFAKSRNTDPLLANMKTNVPAALGSSTVRGTASQIVMPTTTASASNYPPSLFGNIIGAPIQSEVKPRVGVMPPGTPPIVAYREPQTPPANTVAAQPSPAVAPPAVAASPVVPALATPPATKAAMPIAPTMVAAAPTAPTPPIPPAELRTPPTPALAVEPITTVSVADAPPTGELPREIQLAIVDVKTHKRPSFRMEAASTLAESAHARHADVKSALMHVAVNDKAGVVRAHCITLLGTLGATDSNWIESLRKWTRDADEPAVQTAATETLKKLGY